MFDDLALAYRLGQFWLALKGGRVTSEMLYQLLTVAAPLIGTAVTTLCKSVLPKLPKALMPVISTIAGALAAVLAGLDAPEALALGGSSVALREIYDQTKKAM